MSILSPEQQAALAATRRRAAGRARTLAGQPLLLASDVGSYITATVLVVDGGALARVV